jgi:hypothetical protein
MKGAIITSKSIEYLQVPYTIILLGKCLSVVWALTNRLTLKDKETLFGRDLTFQALDKNSKYLSVTTPCSFMEITKIVYNMNCSLYPSIFLKITRITKSPKASKSSKYHQYPELLKGRQTPYEGRYKKTNSMEELQVW